jgi:hypothetical protein
MKGANEPFAPWTFATVTAALVATLLFFTVGVNWVTVALVAAAWWFVWSFATDHPPKGRRPRLPRDDFDGDDYD